MYSMTGYGRAAVEREGRQLTLELKSVNHRFLDIAPRIPRSLGFLEDEMRRRIGTRVARGHVDVFATYRNLREDARTVQVDRGLFLAYRRALAQLAGEQGQEGEALADDRSLMKLAKLPDVLVVTEAEEDQEALAALMDQGLDQALDMLCQMRRREGEALKADMLGQLEGLRGLVEAIRARYPQTVAQYQVRLKERMEELLSTPVEEARLLQEVALMADRSAISEELVRLDSHIAQMREAMDSGQPVGRKLDFIVQELNREVNTISSKSQDIPITQAVVAAKAQIEKLREQVQNVE
ncbi:MAG TPA: YicC family protein [Candidatus Excrementavichristensenella intestinipullorum]|nr:YicC family protein [Candidatus Excrementavichristensenella intestinipullorum]